MGSLGRETGVALEGEAKHEMLRDASAPAGDALTAIYRQSLFWTPERQALSAWAEHVPFAFWLVDVLRPATIVELGTHTGMSYSAMCQAVKALSLPARCFAIDTWKGGEHAGFYSEEVYREFAAFHDPRYGAFSRLVRSTFDEALPHFEDASIDLLHIDGVHTFEAVRHDFLSWQAKLASNAIVILHDTNVRERGSGVFRLWEEISAGKPHFAFLHGHGLGVLGLGRDYERPLQVLFDATGNGHAASSIRSMFAYLGHSVAFLGERAELAALRAKEEALHVDLDRTRAEFDRLRRESEAALTRERRAAAWRDSLLRGELLEADRDRARLQAELADLQRASPVLHPFRKRTSSQKVPDILEPQDLENHLAALYASSSWRLTAPVRWLGDLIRFKKAAAPDFSQEPRSAEELRQRIAAIYASRSWRLAAPLRFIAERMRAAGSRREASLDQIRRGAVQERSNAQSNARGEVDLASSGPPASLQSTGVAGARRTAASLQDVLIVAPHLPLTDFHSGDLRLFTIVELLVRAGRQVVFASTSDRDTHDRHLVRSGERPRYERALIEAGVSHVLYGVDELTAALEASGRALQLAFIAFPEVAQLVLPLVRAYASTARVLYDMVDFHAVRMAREAALSGNPGLAEEADRMRRLESANITAADLTLAISEEERSAALQAVPTARVAVLPNLFRIPQGEPPGPDGRDGILFVGGFWHKPNVDAVQWFSQEIWPLIREGAPDARFRIVGSNPTEEVIALGRLAGVEVIGYVRELAPLYARCRLFVAPLRYGAGMKGKVGHSLAYGLPVVATPIGTEGMKLRHGHDILIAEEPAAFAEASLRLLREDMLWRQLQRNGLCFVGRELSIEVVARMLTTVMDG